MRRIIITSCKKKETEDSDLEGAKDHAMAETHSNDITNIGTEASYNNITTYKLGNPNQVFSGCATITFDTLDASNSDTLKVDFGTGCTGGDMRVRKGVIWYIHNHNMHYRDSGNVITVSTPGNTYYVDGNQVIINSKTISNMGHVGGYLTWNVTANITIHKSAGGIVSWSTNKTKILLAGEMPNNQPIDWPHAKVGIYGDASGTTAKGESFTVHVAQGNRLERNFICGTYRKFFVAGILEFTPGSKPTRYVNFGTGACDDQAVVTINGHTYNVTLH